MIQPNELKLHLPIELSNGVLSTTTKVWKVLLTSKHGDLESIKKMASECHELLYAQYNYTPPIHFAVREGHTDLVKYLLHNGAHASSYKIYPFNESLEVIAEDRGYNDIVLLLNDYASDPLLQKYQGDNGAITYNRTILQTQFEKAVYEQDFKQTQEILTQYPEFAADETYFWGEGILTFAAKENNHTMIDLLISHGAKVPAILKWAQFYYFEHDKGAAYMMEKGMNANTMSWHHVTILHDMAQKGNIQKAELLLKYGAYINAVEEEFQSTPLGMATRWGHIEMVEYLIKQKADINKAGALWATPLAWAKKKGHSEIEKVLIDAGAV